MSLGPRVRGWLAERYNIGAFERFSREQAGKRLPTHVGFWHTFGSLSIFLLLNQIVTGILLMVYYRPTDKTAFESVRFIITHAHFGWLIRGLHAWGAMLMILCVLIHMVRTFVMGAYKKPREITWILGVFIFGCTLTFGFTGYLLPWNQLSYWATVVGTEVAGAIPMVGNYMKTLLRGGVGVGGETLSRFYVMHVVVLPWVLVGLVAVHVFFMRVQGLATLEAVGKETGIEKKKGIRFAPDHLLKEGVVFSVLVGILFTLTVLMPVELGEKADPLNTPHGIKPEWYFLPTYQLLKYFPKTLGLFVSVLPPLVLLLWPFIDRSIERHPRRRRIPVAIGVSALCLALVFGFLGYISERTVTIGGQAWEIDNKGIPHRIVSKAHQEGRHDYEVAGETE
jgi:quinol-cytochrome oxidoreductase complex cytochrome b subunit